MPSPVIHLGINNCFAVKRWSEPEAWASIIAQELGLDVYQFSADLLPPSFGADAARDQIDETRRAAERHGLSAHSVFTGLGVYSGNLLLDARPDIRRHAVDWYREFIDLGARLGARGAGGYVGGLSVRSARSPETRDRLLAAQREAMRELADHAASAGLEFLLFENMAVPREYGTGLEEARDLERSLSGSGVPWVLCLDLGHPVASAERDAGDRLARWLTSPWGRTPVIQLQQASEGVDSHGPFTARTAQTGRVERDRVLEKLMDWPAEEIFLFLEVIPAHEADDDQVLDDLKQSIDHWREGIAALNAA